MFTRAEAAAATIVSFPAAAIVLAYGADAIGLAIHPTPILLLAVAAAAGFGWGLLQHARGERVEPRAEGLELLAFFGIVAAVAAWLLWRGWPRLLPIGGGSDLTHHLLLIDYIDRTGRLVHDRALTPYLGEMLDYTPGAHLLAVLAGRWTRTDGLHAIYAVVALSVAVKAGVVFLIALRCLPLREKVASFGAGSLRTPLALVAPLLLFLPYDYFLGSFAHDSFLAQVVAELFAVTMWWAIVCWDQEPGTVAATLVGFTGAATFLTWPVWIGPTIVTFAAVVWLRGDRSIFDRLRHLAVALAPIAIIAGVHAAGRLGTATTMAGASGFAPIPTRATMGWLFPAAGIAGVVVALRDRRARIIPLLLAAIALQAIALVVIARVSRAEAPYLALKMFYLAIYPIAVAGSIAASWVIGMINGERGVGRASPSLAAWALVALLIVPIGQSVRSTPRPAPVISDALLDAGRWARAHVPPACVDYLVADDDSAYWLHVVVLGNPRAAKRSLDPDTYEPQKALVRWILPSGLPYAIAEDADALPRDIRTNIDVLSRFGRAAVVKRRGASSCPP